MKTSRIAIWVVLSFLCIVIILCLASSLISSKLEQQIPKYKLGTYRVKVKDIRTNLLAGNITLYNAQLYHTVGYGSISVPKLKLQGIRVLKLLLNKKIALKKLLIDSAYINLYLDLNNKPILPEKSSNSSKYSLEKINRIEIIKANFLISHTDSIRQDSIFSTQFNLDLWGVSTIEAKELSYKKVNFDRVNFSLENGFYLFPNRLYKISYDTINYIGGENRLTIDLLMLKSRYAKYEIGAHTGTEADWFDFTAQGINMEEIGLQNLLSQNALIMSQIEISKFTGFAFKDKRLPFPEKPNKNLPMELLDSLPFTLHVDSIKIEDTNIEYAERVKDSKEAGSVTFNNITAIIKNLSNIDSLITGPTTMHAIANVMNEATLTADFIFPNIKFSHLYSVKGDLESMDIASFNPILKQNAAVLVKSGKINDLSFDFIYNNEHSQGTLCFDYIDLKIDIIDKRDSRVKKTQTFLINNILLHKHNTRAKEPFREGNISFSRDKKRSIFNYWWKSIYSGIKSTAIF